MVTVDKPENAMHGIVWEWCSDWGGSGLSGGTDPVGPEAGSYRVLRGGSWGNSPTPLLSRGGPQRRPGGPRKHPGLPCGPQSVGTVNSSEGTEGEGGCRSRTLPQRRRGVGSFHTAKPYGESHDRSARVFRNRYRFWGRLFAGCWGSTPILRQRTKCPLPSLSPQRPALQRCRRPSPFLTHIKAPSKFVMRQIPYATVVFATNILKEKK